MIEMILSSTERMLQCWGKQEFGENFQVDLESVCQRVLLFLPLLPAQWVSPAMEARPVPGLSLVTGRFPICIHAQSQLPCPVSSFLNLMVTISYPTPHFPNVSLKEIPLLLFLLEFQGRSETRYSCSAPPRFLHAPAPSCWKPKLRLGRP